MRADGPILAHMVAVEDLRSRLEAVFPGIVDELSELVSIPSVSSDPAHAEDVQQSAEHVRDLFRSAGVDVAVARAENPDGTPGRPAVLGRTSPERVGAPTVLLYAHHDVQPAGELEKWSSDPFTAEKRGNRLYGRGSSDDGAGVMVHLGALRLLGAELGVNVVLFIEGEEEVGSPSFVDFLEKHLESMRSDVIIVADSGNWKVGEPAITTTLRGNCIVTVDVTVADHAVHSGQFGGPVLDAVTLASQMIAKLHDENGDVAVPGLGGSDTADVDWPEDEFREAVGLVDGYRLAGTGDLAARVWTKPAINVIGFDARPVAQASNTIAPHARFRLSMRTVPDVDPREPGEKLVEYLKGLAPFGARVDVTLNEAGPGYVADVESEAAKDLKWALEEGFGHPVVNTGEGGSIPFISDFQRLFPQAQVLVTGVEDPNSNAHSEDESQSLPDLKAAILSEALLLAKLAEDQA